MPKKKHPPRKKKRSKPQQPKRAAGKRREKQKPVPARIKLEVPSHEQNLIYVLVLFAPALVAGVIALDYQPKNLLLFVLLISSLLSATVFGTLYYQLRKLAPLKEYHSILELKRSIDKGAVHQGHERLIVKLKAVVHGIILVSLLLAFFFFSVSLQATALLICICSLLGLLKQLKLDTPKTILLHVVSTIAAMTAMSILGVFTQTRVINPAVGVIGFVPSTLLGAALTALHSAVFESQRWRRLRLVNTRKGESIQRPGLLAMLYSSLLFVGPTTVFVLATAGKLPVSFMTAGIVLLSAPHLATAYQTSSLSNTELFVRTLRQALVMTIAIAAAAAIAAS